MKAIFEYDNGKKYHVDVQYFEVLGKQLVVYIDTESLSKAIKKANKAVPGVRYTHPDSSVCWFIQGDDIYAESKRVGGSWLTNAYTVESLQEAVEYGELVVYKSNIYVKY